MLTDALPLLGFLGLGEMGGPMTRDLIAAGYPVAGYDRSQERLSACAAAGVHA